MFDFEKLDMFKKAKQFNTAIQELLLHKKVDSVTTNQPRRASFSIVLNIPEGSGRFSKKDRRNFFVIARSSVFERVATLDLLKDGSDISPSTYSNFESKADE